MVSSHSRNAVPDDLQVVASWIASQRECALWAGPAVPYPLELSALPDQIGMAGAINVALDDDQGLVAFGQAVPRTPRRAHLARVIVRPGARGRGLGRALLEALLARVEVAGLSPVTLNVYRDNAAAVALYAELGFRRVERPDGDPASAGIWFMQRSIDPSAVCPARRVCSRVEAHSEEVHMIVRPETELDLDGIREVNIVAFQGHPYSKQTEHLIVEALRAAGALESSLVAESEGHIVGHIAVSAAEIGDSATGWFLLGPVAVQPDRQGEGIGRALVESGLDTLRSRGARGCVLVGDPAFYTRFGFGQCPGVTWSGVPQENVLCLLMSGEMPTGEVTHHPAFLTGM